MAERHVELYETLKAVLGPEAARVIAEAMPPREELATKSDVERLQAATKSDLERLRTATKSDLEQLRTELAEFRADMFSRMAAFESRVMRVVLDLTQTIADTESRIMGRLWMMFIPLWVGLFGLIGTLIVRGG